MSLERKYLIRRVVLILGLGCVVIGPITFAIIDRIQTSRLPRIAGVTIVDAGSGVPEYAEWKNPVEAGCARVLPEQPATHAGAPWREYSKADEFRMKPSQKAQEVVDTLRDVSAFYDRQVRAEWRLHLVSSPQIVAYIECLNQHGRQLELDAEHYRLLLQNPSVSARLVDHSHRR
jgi:hypothetical protein